MSSRFPVTIDHVAYDSKPQNAEIGCITRRLQASGPVEASPEELAEAIASGHTWCGGCYQASPRGWGAFIGQRIGGLDFDNDVIVRGPDGKPLKDAEGHVVKRDLQPAEEGYLGPWEALDRWRSTFGGDPLIVYPSFRFAQISDLSQPPTKCKYRIVFDVGELVTTEARAKALLTKLLTVFPEADRACSNPNRLYFGGRGKAVVYSEGRPIYVRA